MLDMMSVIDIDDRNDCDDEDEKQIVLFSTEHSIGNTSQSLFEQFLQNISIISSEVPDDNNPEDNMSDNSSDNAIVIGMTTNDGQFHYDLRLSP